MQFWTTLSLFFCRNRYLHRYRYFDRYLKYYYLLIDTRRRYEVTAHPLLWHNNRSIMRPVGSVLKMPNLDIIFGGRQRLRYSMTGAFVLASSPGRPDTASGNFTAHRTERTQCPCGQISG